MKTRVLLLSVWAALLAVACTIENTSDNSSQVEPPTAIAVSPETLGTSPDASTLTLTVTAPTRPTLVTDAGWVSVREQGVYKDYKLSYTLTVSAHTGYDPREAVLMVSAGSLTKTITLTQQGREKPHGGLDLNPVTSGATTQAQELYRFLLDNYGKKSLSAVMADVNWNTDIAQKVYQYTGKYPSINCFDFIHIPASGTWIDYSDISPVKNWHDAGGIVALMWHFNVPVQEGSSEQSFYSDKTSFSPSRALHDGTWEHSWYIKYLDQVADVILKLQEAGIAAIWRPYHEAAGNYYAKTWKGNAWFWWGTEGPEVYRQLWDHMFEYFAQKGIRNLIWVWTAQGTNQDASSYGSDEPYYPGNDKVDLVARDIYGSTASKIAADFADMQATYPRKMITLGECGRGDSGAFPAWSSVWEQGARWSWFMPWCDNHATMVSWDWWKEVMALDDVLSRESVAVWESAALAARNMGVGWNLGNTLDSNSGDVNNLWIEKYTDGSPTAYETAWGQPVTTRALLHMFQEAGFRSIRVPVTWYPHMDEEGKVDAAWMDRVQEVVDYVMDEGLYCILNVHHDTGEANTAWLRADRTIYNNTRERYGSLWTQIATRFASYGPKLVFESFNEMLDANSTWNASTSEAHEVINLYNASFVTAVRATGGNNAQRNLILNTYSAGTQPQALNDFKLPQDSVEGHLMAEVHSYAPFHFAFNVEEGAKTVFDASCEADVKQQMKNVYDCLVSKGIPCVLGEYGCTSERSETEMSKQAACYIEAAQQCNIPCFYWMALSDGEDRSVPQWTKPGLKDAIIQAYNDSKR